MPEENLGIKPAAAGTTTAAMALNWLRTSRDPRVARRVGKLPPPSVWLAGTLLVARKRTVPG